MFYLSKLLEANDIASLQRRVITTYVNSLLEVLEANLTFVPSSTSKNEVPDISLYDHMKYTAAIGSCIYEYLKEQKVSDWRVELVQCNQEFYEKKVYLLYSMDLSGIQDFIYGQYGNKDVLKNLRARSFYLEIMLENMIDELLDRVGISRANLIYSGGGHAYLILPNTKMVVEKVNLYKQEVNIWLQEYFKTDLFIACGYTACSANELMNTEEGSYQQIFRNVSNKISESKLQRYSAEDILKLNRSRLRCW